MALRVYARAKPTGFKSPALEAALRNMGKLPLSLAKVGAAITREVRANLSGRILRKQTGKLHDSWRWLINAANNGWQLTVGSDVVYARIHNFGGFTGRNNATRIKKTRYLDRAVLAKKAQVRAILRDFMANLTRG